MNIRISHYLKFVGDEAKKILEQYDDIETMYVADGHHRLYTTSMVRNKKKYSKLAFWDFQKFKFCQLIG